MYYIINENQQILASDEHFLEQCNVSDITALNKAILLEELSLNQSTKKRGEKTLTIKYKNQTSLFSVQMIKLSSLIGSLSLVVLDPMKIENTEHSKTQEIAIENLIINNQSNNLITDIEKELSMQKFMSHTDHKNIFIDTVEISQKIGVSEKDYQDFFNDYISTALSLEKDLRNHADSAQSSAIETLLHLGKVLHLDLMQENIIRIQNASSEQTPSEVASFYEMLSRITLQKPGHAAILDEIDSRQPQEKVDLAFTPPKEDVFDLDLLPIADTTKPEDSKTSQDNPVKLDLNLPLLKSEDETSSQEEITTSDVDTHPVSTNQSDTTLELSEVKPIDFDFSLSAAAEELSLPENLIKEFMLDFISQTHNETETMLKAYQNNDLETIQKTGHLLKGVASNLRIITLSDALYKIQFCNNLPESKSLIQNFWGHFLSFEAQMNVPSR